MPLLLILSILLCLWLGAPGFAAFFAVLLVLIIL